MSKLGKSDCSEELDEYAGERLEIGKGSRKCFDEKSEILKSFQNYAILLDKKYDKYERLVKISRDVTIESKRIIFLLHSIDRGRERQQVLLEAKKRLDNLVKDSFFRIAKELEGDDPYLFHRAFTAGTQEFIEAYTFYHYLKEKNLYSWDFYQNLLNYDGEQELKRNENNQSSNKIQTVLPQSDFILGLADLTGELMRKCICSLGTGDISTCFETCEVVKKLYAGFLSIASYKTKETSEKMYTLKQNILKMEKVCYNINVRSKEFPEEVAIHLASGF